MGKYMKKARGGGGVMEMMTQGHLGVRTRARAQAMEKKEIARTSTSPHKVSSSTSTKSFMPVQISYLELRSRRLEKSVGSAGNKLPPSPQKVASSDECRRLSDLTNSDMLADDCSSRLALSTEEAQNTRRQTRQLTCSENREFPYHVLHEDDGAPKSRMHTRQLTCDENREFSYHLFHGDNEVEEDDSLPCSVRSLQQLRMGAHGRGRAPPGVAHSRSNSRSNSVTRELPPPTPKLPPRGILTRNQRKMEMQISNTICYKDAEIPDIDIDVDAFCNRHVQEAQGNSNISYFSKNVDVEGSFGETPVDEGLFTSNRLARERTPISGTRQVEEALGSAARLQCGLAIHKEMAVPSNLQSSLDMEIEDFFLQAEQKEQKRFIERYNFDPVNDTPLPGRYNWVRL